MSKRKTGQITPPPYAIKLAYTPILLGLKAFLQTNTRSDTNIKFLASLVLQGRIQGGGTFFPLSIFRASAPPSRVKRNDKKGGNVKKEREIGKRFFCPNIGLI